MNPNSRGSWVLLRPEGIDDELVGLVLGRDRNRRFRGITISLKSRLKSVVRVRTIEPHFDDAQVILDRTGRVERYQTKSARHGSAQADQDAIFKAARQRHATDRGGYRACASSKSSARESTIPAANSAAKASLPSKPRAVSAQAPAMRANSGCRDSLISPNICSAQPKNCAARSG